MTRPSTNPQFIGAHPDEATAIYAPNPPPVVAVAHSFNNIPDIARR
jgi:hypothetical protein